MDLRVLSDVPTVEEMEAVDGVIGSALTVSNSGRVVRGGATARRQRHLLLPALHAVQDRIGSISRGAVAYVSERLAIPPADVYGVATFYSLFQVDSPAGERVEACDDVVCWSRQSNARMDASHSSPCLGQCDRSPASLVSVPGKGRRVVLGGESGSIVPQDRTGLRLLRRIDVVDPGSIHVYQSSGGFEALETARRIGPKAVLDALDRSGLRGRGGAAFPIGAKWRAVAESSRPIKYIVANGDESEPGTFKDRVLMEGDPFAVVEALALAGYVTGASKGFLYVRGEYPLAEERLRSAIAQTGSAGILGNRDRFDIELRRGAGAYVCGEETALFASIEGFRGEPRQKPPFPTEHGLFGMPTVVNNIETLVSALEVMRVGAEEFASIGTPESTGPKLFCLSGDISRPGVYEMPMGVRLGDLIDAAGGVPGGGCPAAVLVGGAAGSFAGPDSLDLEMSFEGAREEGHTLGSGAVVVFDDSTDFWPIVQRIARFFRDESCGQCVPCRVGTVRQTEALDRLRTGSLLGSEADEMSRLDDLAAVMRDASICGLGQTASTAVQSAFELGLLGTGHG